MNQTDQEGGSRLLQLGFMKVPPDSRLKHSSHKHNEGTRDTIHALRLKFPRPDLVPNRDQIVKEEPREFVRLPNLGACLNPLYQMSLIRSLILGH